jgi:putative nucleotidyltransferase with HDIG domain
MPGFPIERLWKHSMATGLLARRIAAAEGGDLGVIEAAFAAGVLHDIGKLVYGFSMPQLYKMALERAAEKNLPQWKAETEVIGASHAEVGAYLLGLWGLPAAIVEAVAWHHHPTERDPCEFSALTAVHVANYVHGRQTPSSEMPLPQSLDRDYVASLKLQTQLSTWEDPGNPS